MAVRIKIEEITAKDNTIHLSPVDEGIGTAWCLSLGKILVGNAHRVNRISGA
jgi:hypothetical protein